MIAHHGSIFMPMHYLLECNLVDKYRMTEFQSADQNIQNSFALSSVLYQTRVQSSTLSFPELISKLPQIGLRGLYRGSIPAILGQFSRCALFHCLYAKSVVAVETKSCHFCSHGLRTGIFEASKLVLINVAPALPEIQVHFGTPLPPCAKFASSISAVQAQAHLIKLMIELFKTS